MGIETAIAGGSIASGLLGSSGGVGTRERRKARQELRKNAGIAAGYLQPYEAIGREGLDQYTNALSPDTDIYNALSPQGRFEFNLEEDPIYQYQRDQALQASTRGLNAAGHQVSGNLATELARVAAGEAGRYQDNAFRRQLSSSQENYGRGITEYDLEADRNRDIYGRGQNYLNRLQGLGNMGAQAATGLSNIYGALGPSLAGVWQRTGDAKMAQNQYRNESINNAIQGGISNYLLADALRGLPRSGQPA